MRWGGGTHEIVLDDDTTSSRVHDVSLDDLGCDDTLFGIEARKRQKRRGLEQVSASILKDSDAHVRL